MCSTCKENKATSNGRCLGCNAAYLRRYRATPHGRRKNLDSNLKARFGITMDDKDRMQKEQNDRCAICRRHVDEVGVLCVDHDHETDVVRGLLCNPCNKGIGFFADDLDRLRNAIEYLALVATK